MPKHRGNGNDLWAQVAYYASLGFILPGAALAGFGLGWLVDRWLHTAPIFALILSLVGAVGGVIEIVQILTRAEKKDDADKHEV
jgi:F0F1-type ATP synthase assembly protein I